MSEPSTPRDETSDSEPAPNPPPDLRKFLWDHLRGAFEAKLCESESLKSRAPALVVLLDGESIEADSILDAIPEETANGPSDGTS